MTVFIKYIIIESFQQGFSNELDVCVPCFLLVAGDPGHEDGQVVLAAALDGDAERAVPRPRQLHPPQPRLHVVGVLVLPDAELLPLERDVVAAQPGQVTVTHLEYAQAQNMFR